jgi:hypothetical protein
MIPQIATANTIGELIEALKKSPPETLCTVPQMVIRGQTVEASLVISFLDPIQEQRGWSCSVFSESRGVKFAHIVLEKLPEEGMVFRHEGRDYAVLAVEVTNQQELQAKIRVLESER